MGTPGDISINAEATTTSTTAVTLYLQEPGNLLTNPGGETGDMTGWTILQNGGSGWAAAAGDPVIHLFGQKVFITSYALDTRSQLLDLTTLGYTQAQLDAAPPINVREWYHGGGYNTADSYYLKVELRDGSNNVLASLNDGATSTTTNGTWQVSAQTFTGYGTGLRYVYFEDGGHDVENWAGQYGAAMDEASVAVGAVQMRLSNDGTTWTAWAPFASSTPWTLDAASGLKTVYVQYLDALNQMWPPISATITLSGSSSSSNSSSSSSASSSSSSSSSASSSSSSGTTNDGGASMYTFANPLQVDLSSILNVDAVASSASNGESYPPLYEMDGEGDDYMTEAVAEASSDTGAGLPNNGAFAANSDHPNIQLAFSDSTTGPNAFILDDPATSILTVTFPMVVTSYSTVQIYGTSTEGSSNLTVTLTYTDSSTDVTSVTVPDWFQSFNASAPVFVVQQGLSRWNSNGDDLSDTPALYGCTANANAAKTLASVTITTTGAGRFVLFGATAY